MYWDSMAALSTLSLSTFYGALKSEAPTRWWAEYSQRSCAVTGGACTSCPLGTTGNRLRCGAPRIRSATARS